MRGEHLRQCRPKPDEAPARMAAGDRKAEGAIQVGVREVFQFRHPRESGDPASSNPLEKSGIPAWAGTTGIWVGPGADQPICPKHHRRMLFCACNRFSASAQISDCGPSMTSGVTSSPRCAGRQWRNFASGLAAAISAAST